MKTLHLVQIHWNMFGMLTALNSIDGNLSVTASGQDAGNEYAGTDSITFILDTSAPSVVLIDAMLIIYFTTLSPTQTVTITALGSYVGHPFYIYYRSSDKCINDQN